MSYQNRGIPVPEGKGKEKRRSFLPTPKSFGFQKETQEPRVFSPPPEDQSADDLRVGDRITINGVKSGTLRYFGKTHIASGFWCGIELDEPEGKHDGSVEGVRYFECEFGYGIFAPLDRVAKLEEVADPKFQQVKQIAQPKPKRRSLPQPKTQASNVDLLRYKIIEEQEEANQYFDQRQQVGRSQFQNQDHLYDRKNLNIDDLLQEQYGDATEKKLSSTFTISDEARGAESYDHSYSAQKRTPRNSGQRKHRSSVSTDSQLEVDGNALNYTYTLPNEKIEQLSRTFNDSASSGDDSIGPELKECLNSDGRQYFNLTFDTEGNNSPKQSNILKDSEKHESQELQDDLDIINTKPDLMSVSMTSSLGVLDLEDVLYRSDLLTDDLILDCSNLTDSEKIVQSCEKSKRVASLNETFENKSVITSTPLVTEKSRSQLDHTQTLAKSRMQSNDPILEEADELSQEQALEDLRQNLNSTFQVNSNKHLDLPIVGEDTLDWRHEASDSENQQSDDSLEESFNSVHKNIFKQQLKGNNLNATFGLDSLTDKLENLELDKRDSLHGEESLNIKSQHLNLDRPMIDSGISVKGLTDSTASLQTSTEGIIFRQRKPMTDSGISLQSDQGMGDSQEMRWSQNLDSLQELSETGCFTERIQVDPSQLAKDLQAGHDKRGRPLSLISTTSADTGYVPDTDSEMGTVTMTSPTDWLERPSEVKAATGLEEDYDKTFKHYQAAVLKGTRRARDIESDSDMYSDAGTILADSSTLREVSSDIDNIGSLSGDVKGISTNQIPELNPDIASSIQPKVVSVVSDDNIEDERIEADQQLDLLKETKESGEGAEISEEQKVNIQVVDNDDANTSSEKKDEDTDANNSSSKPQTGGKKKEIEKSEYKKPKVASRLADYIKQPVPELTEEEKLERAKNRKNKFQKNVKKEVKKEEKNTESEERHHKKVEKEPPKIIKRTPPKSKWDAVMNKIETNQAVPPKPKTEVKSKLQEYLSTPPPAKKEPEIKQPKKISSMPTPDYSKVKSKLSMISSPPPKKVENTEKTKRRSKLPQGGSVRKSSLSSNASSIPKLDLNESAGSNTVLSSALTSARSSCSDLQRAGQDSARSVDKPANPSIGRLSMPGKPTTKRDRRDSTSSTISNISQTSSRAQTDRSSKLGERVSLRRQSMPVKSSIPPPTDLPRKASVANRNTTNKSTKPLSTVKDSPSPTKTNKDINSNRNKTKTNKNVPKPSHKPEPEPKLTLSHAKQEIERLEALCESRTKELNLAKIEMKSTLSGFDAMAALVNYLSNDLNAFSCPKLAAQLQTLQHQFTGVQTQNDDLKSHKSRLEQEITDLCTKHEQEKQGIVHDNEKALAAEIVKFTLEKTRALQIAEETHSRVLNQVKTFHNDEISRLKLDHTEEFMKVQLKHKDDILRLQSKHEGQMEELHKQHRDKLEEITKRFEAMKMNLSDKVETLRSECDDLRIRARESEDMLLRDSDIKVQMAIARYKHMPAEIESLKQVLDMKNDEILKLRNKNIDLGKVVEELNSAKDKILNQKQKIENLEAIITMKTDHEKQINEKCQMLMKKYDKESKANKRLSMDYEELMWRMSQSEGSLENLLKGGSPTSAELSSPVLRRKTLSPTVSEHSPARSPAYRRSISSTGNNGEKSQDKKWKRKSASYLMEERRTSPSRGSPLRTHLMSESLPNRHHSGSDSLPNSPRIQKPSGRNNRMSHSCNDVEVFEGPQPLPSPEAPPDLSYSCDSDYFTSDKTDSSDRDTSTTISQSEDSISVTIYEGKHNGVTSPETDTNHEDVSEISHSTDSCGVGSLVWDYENNDVSSKSMETSSNRSMESSVASDTILEANGNDTSENCTFSNSSTVENMSMPHSPEKGEDIHIVPNNDLSDHGEEASDQKEATVTLANGGVPKSKIPSFQGMKESTV